MRRAILAFLVCAQLVVSGFAMRLGFGFGSFGGCSTPSVVPPMHVFFLAGQSNAEGFGGTDSPAGFPDSSIPLVVRIGDATHGPSNWFYTSGNTPIDLGPASTTGGTFHSIELAAAKQLQTAGWRMAAVKVSVNGSHIAEWAKGNVNGYYQALVDARNLAISLWGSDAIIHFVWLQSEQDAIDNTATYEASLRQFVLDTKADIGWLNFWQCKLQPSQVSGQPGGPMVVAAQAQVMSERSDTNLLDFDSVNGNLHYTGPQLATMGGIAATYIFLGYVPAEFTGTATLTSAASGDIEADRAFTGTAVITSECAGDLAVAGGGSDVPVDFTGTAAVTSAAAGNLTKYGALDPLTIVTSKSWLTYLVSDRGITLNGSGVSNWADQSGNGKDAAQATAANQPTFAANALNGHPSIIGDGTNDVLVFGTLDLPAPGTTPSFFWAVFRTVTWSSNDSLYAGNTTTTMRLRHITASPNFGAINASAGTQNTTGAPVGTFVRLENLFSNTTGDYIKLGSVKTTVPGLNTGNNDPASGAMCLLAQSTTGTSAINAEILAFGILNGEPTSGEKSALDAWVANYYGNTVNV